MMNDLHVDPIVADFLARIARVSPLVAWVMEADAAHQAWIEGLRDHDRRRIRAAFEARFAATDQS